MSTKEIEIDSLTEAREALQTVFEWLSSTMPKRCAHSHEVSQTIVNYAAKQYGHLDTMEVVVASVAIAFASLLTIEGMSNANN